MRAWDGRGEWARIKWYKRWVSEEKEKRRTECWNDGWVVVMLVRKAEPTKAKIMRNNTCKQEVACGRPLFIRAPKLARYLARDHAKNCD